jgi:membrane protease YdiL (CAAX protease family)
MAGQPAARHPRHLPVFVAATSSADSSTNTRPPEFANPTGWFALILVMFLFNTVLGEELLFRGLLLPRMKGAFGRRDWLANGVLFAAYHAHVPWGIPAALVVDTFAIAYPSRRYQSAWIGIAVHSAQSVFFAAIILALVL